MISIQGITLTNGRFSKKGVMMVKSNCYSEHLLFRPIDLRLPLFTQFPREKESRYKYLNLLLFSRELSINHGHSSTYNYGWMKLIYNP